MERGDQDDMLLDPELEQNDAELQWDTSWDPVILPQYDGATYPRQFISDPERQQDVSASPQSVSLEENGMDLQWDAYTPNLVTLVQVEYSASGFSGFGSANSQPECMGIELLEGKEEGSILYSCSMAGQHMENSSEGNCINESRSDSTFLSCASFWSMDVDDNLMPAPNKHTRTEYLLQCLPKLKERFGPVSASKALPPETNVLGMQHTTMDTAERCQNWLQESDPYLQKTAKITKDLFWSGSQKVIDGGYVSWQAACGHQAYSSHDSRTSLASTRTDICNTHEPVHTRSSSSGKFLSATDSSHSNQHCISLKSEVLVKRLTRTSDTLCEPSSVVVTSPHIAVKKYCCIVALDKDVDIQCDMNSSLMISGYNAMASEKTFITHRKGALGERDSKSHDMTSPSGLNLVRLKSEPLVETASLGVQCHMSGKTDTSNISTGMCNGYGHLGEACPASEEEIRQKVAFPCGIRKYRSLSLNDLLEMCSSDSTGISDIIANGKPGFEQDTSASTVDVDLGDELLVPSDTRILHKAVMDELHLHKPPKFDEESETDINGLQPHNVHPNLSCVEKDKLKNGSQLDDISAGVTQTMFKSVVEREEDFVTTNKLSTNMQKSAPVSDGVLSDSAHLGGVGKHNISSDSGETSKQQVTAFETYSNQNGQSISTDCHKTCIKHQCLFAGHACTDFPKTPNFACVSKESRDNRNVPEQAVLDEAVSPVTADNRLEKNHPYRSSGISTVAEDAKTLNTLNTASMISKYENSCDVPEQTTPVEEASAVVAGNQLKENPPYTPPGISTEDDDSKTLNTLSTASPISKYKRVCDVPEETIPDEEASAIVAGNHLKDNYPYRPAGISTIAEDAQTENTPNIVPVIEKYEKVCDVLEESTPHEEASSIVSGDQLKENPPCTPFGISTVAEDAQALNTLNTASVINKYEKVCDVLEQKTPDEEANPIMASSQLKENHSYTPAGTSTITEDAQTLNTLNTTSVINKYETVCDVLEQTTPDEEANPIMAGNQLKENHISAVTSTVAEDSQTLNTLNTVTNKYEKICDALEQTTPGEEESAIMAGNPLKENHPYRPAGICAITEDAQALNTLNTTSVINKYENVCSDPEQTALDQKRKSPIIMGTLSEENHPHGADRTYCLVNDPQVAPHLTRKHFSETYPCTPEIQHCLAECQSLPTIFENQEAIDESGAPAQREAPKTADHGQCVGRPRRSNSQSAECSGRIPKSRDIRRGGLHATDDFCNLVSQYSLDNDAEVVAAHHNSSFTKGKVHQFQEMLTHKKSSAHDEDITTDTTAYNPTSDSGYVSVGADTRNDSQNDNFIGSESQCSPHPDSDHSKAMSYTKTISNKTFNLKCDSVRGSFGTDQNICVEESDTEPRENITFNKMEQRYPLCGSVYKEAVPIGKAPPKVSDESGPQSSRACQADNDKKENTICIGTETICHSRCDREMPQAVSESKQKTFTASFNVNGSSRFISLGAEEKGVDDGKNTIGKAIHSKCSPHNDSEYSERASKDKLMSDCSHKSKDQSGHVSFGFSLNGNEENVSCNTTELSRFPHTDSGFPDSLSGTVTSGTNTASTDTSTHKDKFMDESADQKCGDQAVGGETGSKQEPLEANKYSETLSHNQPASTNAFSSSNSGYSMSIADRNNDDKPTVGTCDITEDICACCDPNSNNGHSEHMNKTDDNDSSIVAKFGDGGTQSHKTPNSLVAVKTGKKEHQKEACGPDVSDIEYFGNRFSCKHTDGHILRSSPRRGKSESVNCKPCRRCYRNCQTGEDVISTHNGNDTSKTSSTNICAGKCFKSQCVRYFKSEEERRRRVTFQTENANVALSGREGLESSHSSKQDSSDVQDQPTSVILDGRLRRVAIHQSLSSRFTTIYSRYRTPQDRVCVERSRRSGDKSETTSKVNAESSGFEDATDTAEFRLLRLLVHGIKPTFDQESHCTPHQRAQDLQSTTPTKPIKMLDSRIKMHSDDSDPGIK